MGALINVFLRESGPNENSNERVYHPHPSHPTPHEATMNSRQVSDLETLRQAQRFIDDHAAELPTVHSSPVRAELDAIVHSIEQHGETQERCRLDAQELAALRDALRRQLRAEMDQAVTIARGAKATMPSIQNIKMPAPECSDGDLGMAAGGMVKGVTLYRDEFVRLGSPADFVERLDTLAEGLQRAVTVRECALANRQGITVALPEEFRRAWTVVAMLGKLIEQNTPKRSALRGSWADTTLHAERRLKAADVRRLAAAAETKEQLALPPSAPSQSTALTVSDRRESMLVSAPPKILRVIARLFGSERVA